MLTYIIDEDAISLYLTEQVLQMEQFATRVLAFTSAETALAHLLPRLQSGADLPQIVFLDLNMPVMDGWKFLEALAPYENELLRCCRFYLLTSSLAQADTAKAEDYALIAGVIHKPLDEEELRAIAADYNADDKPQMQVDYSRGA